MRYAGALSVSTVENLAYLTSADEMIFMQKRGTAAYLKELASQNKITYTLIFTGNSDLIT